MPELDSELNVSWIKTNAATPQASSFSPSAT
jgi:hypothetical protein